MSVINTNITSMIGQQNLQKSQSALATSMERLSSGLRINSAKDDAAGQAIANRMSSQITGLGQAQRNANDGISVAQTAEGALNQVNDNLQRIRELSVQAQNGTNSQDDLKSIQAEIQQRLGEIDRISEQTDFNGVKVLANDQKLNIQVGANDGEAIEIDLQKINSSTLGLGSFTVAGPQLEDGGIAIADALKAEFGDTTALSTTTVTAQPANTDWQAQFGLAAAPDTTTTPAEVIADDNGNFFLKTTMVTSAADTATMQAQGFEETAAGSNTFEIYLAVDPQAATADTTNGDLEFSVSLADYTDAEITGAASTDPLASLDEALAQVDTLRSDLGAIQNRFESAITNLQTNETNLAAARSRIEDADYAVEVANMTRSQILQQAGTSVLAQANQVPQGVLSLLG
ncbi:MAG: FliC/FljB family flagellin [Gammaproteobacteria bacterium]|jgi:flagellin|nr:FliC/FljB family flagellin [Gammaproteobacteria bacterium]